MKLLATAAIAIASLVAMPTVSFAASCYDLWYERNEIYADNNYCFQTQLAIDTFGEPDDDCDDYPSFTKHEQKRIAQIAKEEKKRKCHVNN